LITNKGLRDKETWTSLKDTLKSGNDLATLTTNGRFIEMLNAMLEAS